jgi:hypothetical protein
MSPGGPAIWLEHNNEGELKSLVRALVNNLVKGRADGYANYGRLMRTGGWAVARAVL